MCICGGIGKDGTSEHSGKICILQWIKSPITQYDWTGREIESCENHLESYLNTGYFKQK